MHGGDATRGANKDLVLCDGFFHRVFFFSFALYSASSQSHAIANVQKNKSFVDFRVGCWWLHADATRGAKRTCVFADGIFFFNFSPFLFSTKRLDGFFFFGNSAWIFFFLGPGQRSTVFLIFWFSVLCSLTAQPFSMCFPSTTHPSPRHTQPCQFPTSSNNSIAPGNSPPREGGEKIPQRGEKKNFPERGRKNSPEREKKISQRVWDRWGVEGLVRWGWMGGVRQG